MVLNNPSKYVILKYDPARYTALSNMIRTSNYSIGQAGVAELADAQDLKSCGSNIVPVQFRSPAVNAKEA